MIKEYACPRCRKPLMILDVHTSGFNYKLICHSCSYYDYDVNLDKLKEFKYGKENKGNYKDTREESIW